MAEEALARTVRDQETEIYEGKATTNRRYIEAVQKHKAAEAALERSRAQVHKAEEALAARSGGVHVLIAEVRAEMAKFVRVKLYTDLVPDSRLSAEESQKQAERNYRWQGETFGDNSLPLYAVIDPRIRYA